MTDGTGWTLAEGNVSIRDTWTWTEVAQNCWPLLIRISPSCFSLALGSLDIKLIDPGVMRPTENSFLSLGNLSSSPSFHYFSHVLSEWHRAEAKRISKAFFPAGHIHVNIWERKRKMKNSQRQEKGKALLTKQDEQIGKWCFRKAFHSSIIHSFHSLNRFYFFLNNILWFLP